ncbi:MAG TPA: HIT domain-containing protein [Ktedonobacteraceae bacterium]|jgi:diadenosine tetraphosphate (Ap4A) HIT family hydrolase
MQRGSNSTPSTTAATDIDCAFCQHDNLTPYILTETMHFYLVTDHAPLVEGHLLIIPKNHFSCYGNVPPSLDPELFMLKETVHRFFARFYIAPIFWEHGIFRQTVRHAHLHCFPFGTLSYNENGELHACILHSQEDLRNWYSKHGHYFYLEDSRYTLIFPPQLDRYYQVIHDVVYPNAAPYLGQAGWRSPQQRFEAGKPLIQSTIVKWQSFEEEGAQYVD